MEQFFVVIVLLLVFLFRGVAGNQRRFPRSWPSEDDSLGSGGPIDVAGTTRQRTAEAQQRALEALQRWEAKQGLRPRAADRGSLDPAQKPEPTRTRAARPAAFARHTTAERNRREAYADIARMLDPSQAKTRPPAPRHRFEVARPGGAASAEASVPDVTSLEDPAELQAVKDRRVRLAAERKAAEGEKKVPGPRRASGRRAGAASLARLEKLPLAARAVVFAEILGPPRSLT